MTVSRLQGCLQCIACLSSQREFCSEREPGACLLHTQHRTFLWNLKKVKCRTLYKKRVLAIPSMEQTSRSGATQGRQHSLPLLPSPEFCLLSFLNLQPKPLILHPSLFLRSWWKTIYYEIKKILVISKLPQGKGTSEPMMSWFDKDNHLTYILSLLFRAETASWWIA